MFIGYGVWLIILGILGAASLIVAKRPDAKDAIAKLAPYQGWIGAVSALGGAWDIVSAVINVGWMTTFPIHFFTFLAVGVVQLLLGFLLGIGVLKSFIKDPKAHEKMDTTLAKLSPYQGTLGLVAIGLGVWLAVESILFFH
jgi:hypothetical protein